jgi:hypothetical protein
VKKLFALLMIGSLAVLGCEKPAPTPPKGKSPSTTEGKKPEDTSKPMDAKPGDAKPEDVKPADAKPADAKPADKDKPK